MHITMDNKQILITGYIEREVCEELYDRIRAAGGITAHEVTRDVDYMVWSGDTRTKKYDKALVMGIPTLHMSELEQWLDDGVRCEGDPRPNASLGELIAEARGVLDGAAMPETWNALVSLCERCAAHALETLTIWGRSRRVYGNVLQRLGKMPPMGGVHKLVYPDGSCESLWALDLARTPGCFPALECIEVGDMWSMDMKSHRSLPEQVKTLILSPHPTRMEGMSHPKRAATRISGILGSHAFMHIKELDLSPMVDVRRWPKDAFMNVLEHMTQATRANALWTLDTLHTGIEPDDELRSAFGRFGVELR